MLLNTPRTRGAWGLIAGQTLDLGGLPLEVGPIARNYAAVILTSLDGQPIEQSARLLLIAAGNAENPGMKWNADRTSCGKEWGEGPATVGVVRGSLRLPSGISAVYTLDGAGRRCEPAVVREGQLMLGSSPALWYELVAER